MTRQYLRPADVEPADAARVLEALNAMRSAEELAAAVEFPDELDIGVGVAARILARRDELGGFASLEQIDAVPLVGPERFTELVLGLLGRPLPWAVSAEEGLAALRAEVAALRAQISALRAVAVSGRLPADRAPELRVDPAGPWLGQPVTITVRAQSAGGRVLVGASTGRLRTAAGGTVVEGASAVVQTDTGGRAALEWWPGAQLPLTPEQRAALPSYLPLLGDAATPSDGTEGLRALAAAYDQQPNRALREAVDALAGTLGRSVPDPRGGWPRADVTLSAVAQAGARPPAGTGTGDAPPVGAVAERPSPGVAVEGEPASGTTVAQFALRDWVPAFEEALRAHLAATSPLRSQLPAVVAASHGAAAGVAVQQRLADYVNRRPGELGQRAAREVARDAVHALLQQTATTELAQREALVPLLTATARAVEAAPTSVLMVTEATGRSVLRDVNLRLPPATLDLISDRLDHVERALDDRVVRSELQVALAAKADRELVTGQLRDLVSQVNTIEQRLERPR